VKAFNRIAARVLNRTHAHRSSLTSWQWADENIDYSRAPNYDTPYLSRFDSRRLPFWREVLEELRNPATREIVVCKSSRSGYSENVILTDARFGICEDPESSFYLSATEDLAKGFLDRRLIRGMALSPELAKRFKKAKFIKEDIRFEDHDFRVTWAANKTSQKQDGHRRLYVDEIDLFPESTIDMIRRRAAAYAMAHIIWGGSIDPTRRGDPGDSPVWKLYQESTKAIWEMPDGEGWFTFEFDGLKWDHAAKTGNEWDLEQAARSAYYETPTGRRIDETERMDLVRRGRWRHTAPNGIRKGYKVTALMCPFADCTFGEVVKRFLSAKGRAFESNAGHVIQPLRVYFAEYWSEPHWSRTEMTSEEALIDRVRDYQYGQLPGDVLPEYKDVPSSILATLDVQKDHFWLCIRQWFSTNGGDSGLVSYQRCEDWKSVFEMANRYKAEKIYVDAAYATRAQEVYEVASKTAGIVPVIGNDRLSATYKREVIDPMEGRPTQGQTAKIVRYTINPDLFRTLVTASVNGETVQKWFIPRGTPAEYSKQVTAMKKVAGKWTKSQKAEHAADCEHLQIFAAHRHKIYEHYQIEPDASATPQTGA
jgi:hypothetical protein